MAARHGQDEVELLSQSPEVYKKVLTTFHDCYYTCYHSEVSIISKQTKTSVEQCAVDFQYVCDQTATLAERISSSWIDDCIIFFEDDKAYASSEMARTIASQSAELGEGFTAIRNWIKKLTTECTRCLKVIEKEKKVCLFEAKERVRVAEVNMIKAGLAREEAEKKARSAVDTQLGWGIASWIPIVNLVAIPVYISCRSDTEKAHEEKSIATTAAAESSAIESKAKTDEEKIKIAAGKLANLIEVLKHMEGIYNGQIAFWKFQADKFHSFSANIQKYKKLELLEVKKKDLLKWLNERKELIDRYYVAMQNVVSGGNFASSLTPSKFPRIDLPNLQLTL